VESGPALSLSSDVGATLGGTNLEFKARVDSLAFARERLRSLGAVLQGVERQEDRYFLVPSGRLKLRVSSHDGAHLVAYLRPEGDRFRTSRFQRLPVADPEGLAETLSTMLGAGPRVIKTREVWWWRDVRVHLDEVEGRGTFVEFEARLDRIGDPGAAAGRLDHLCHALALSDREALRGSYGEMPCPLTT
jgi:adenylate cyclase class 2